MLPSKAGWKEKIEMQSPSSILLQNATNLAFRLFAPFIKMPLRNLCRVSVHSFSLMKHQISFTNNSCVITKHSGPSQHGCHLGQMQCVFQVWSSQNSLPSCYSSHSLDTIWLQPLQKQKESMVFKETQVLCPQHLTWRLGMWCFLDIFLNAHIRPGCNPGTRSAVALPMGGLVNLGLNPLIVSADVVRDRTMRRYPRDNQWVPHQGPAKHVCIWPHLGTAVSKCTFIYSS